jgi:hypothetical protein
MGGTEATARKPNISTKNASPAASCSIGQELKTTPVIMRCELHTLNIKRLVKKRRGAPPAGRLEITMSENQNSLLEQADDVTRINLWWGYVPWFAVYLLLLAVTVVGPGLAAVGFFTDPMTNKWLAGAGALAAALSHALRPHEYATAYDASVQLAWKTHISLVAGIISTEAAANELRQAIDLTTFKYGPAGGIRNQRQTGRTARESSE